MKSCMVLEGQVQESNVERWCCAACRYLRQIAVITPYAKFSFAYVAEDEKNSIRVNFTRRTDKMPAPPKVMS